MFQTKSYGGENQNIHFMLNLPPPPAPEMMPFMRYVDRYGTDRQAADQTMLIRNMRFLGWITKATDTHSEYVIHIAFPQ
jgi:hypothetical protein